MLLERMSSKRAERDAEETDNGRNADGGKYVHP